MSDSLMGYKRVTASAIINEGVTWLYGLLLLTSVTGGDVTLYEGTDAVSGTPIARFEAIADETKPIVLPVPLRLERGLYVAVGANVTEVTLFWAPGGVG